MLNTLSITIRTLIIVVTLVAVSAPAQSESSGTSALAAPATKSAEAMKSAVAAATPPTSAAQPTTAISGVPTREAQVTIGGATYQQIQHDGHDYFIRSARPGSALIEVVCEKPNEMTQAPALALKERSKDFVSRLKEGCAPKQGSSPERFTFEQSTKSAHTRAQAAKSQKVELLGPKSFPADLDPHVLPDQPAAGGNFDWKERRY